VGYYYVQLTKLMKLLFPAIMQVHDLGIHATNAQIMNLRILRALQDILRILRALRLGLRKRQGPEDILKSPQDSQAHILERKLNWQ